MKICKKSIPGKNYLPEMLSLLPFAALLLRCVSAAALLVLLAASTRTRIVRIYLCRSTLLRRVRRRLILVRSGHFRYLLTLNLLLNLHMIQ